MTLHTPSLTGPGRQATFLHPALFYASDQDYLDGVAGFVRTAVREGHPALVAVPGPRLDLLQDALHEDREHVTWIDMTRAGRNPGRILSMLQEFADRHDADAPPWIVGEPIWVGRTPAETGEATRHEALINLAFAGRPASILCPYDTLLPDDVLAQAHRTHPVVRRPDALLPNPAYADPFEVCRDCDTPLPEPRDAVVVTFGEGELATTRETAERWAQSAGLPATRRADWVLAVSEATSNSVRHGGGHGTLRMWRATTELVAEVRDRGRLTDPLTGRRRPDPYAPTGGRGVWIMHQLCDLVEIRAQEDGLVLRLHMSVT